MSLFNISESSLNEYKLMILQEKKTREQYARDKFKKKYNFKPDKPGADTGTITKDGKTYRIDMKKSNKVDFTDTNDLDKKKSVNRELKADLADKDSTISLNSKFFKLKGSNKGSRRDAMLNHEIGHQNLHNLNSDNKTVDQKNKSNAVYANIYSSLYKDEGKKISEKDLKDHFDKSLPKEFSGTKEEQEKRDKSLNIAKKYEKDKPHHNAIEYEADRYAANKTSEKALKRGIRNSYKMERSDLKKLEKRAISNPKKYYPNNTKSEAKKLIKREISDNNKIYQSDMDQRSKALKDKDMKKSDVYK